MHKSHSHAYIHIILGNKVVIYSLYKKASKISTIFALKPRFLICILSCPHLVVTSAFVTGFVSSAATAVITVVVCVAKQKRQRPKDSVTTTTPSGETYDDTAEVTVTNWVVSIYSKLHFADNDK